MVVSIAFAVPSGVKVFNWITTMYQGRVRLTAPMLFCLSGIGLFVIGGITGIFTGSAPVDLLIHDTYYIVGHFHFIIMGIIPFSMFAASYYWYPLFTGRMYNRLVARLQVALLTVGVPILFFPMLVMGLQGLPRRYAEYPPEFASLQGIASFGAGLVAIASVLWLYNMVQSWRVGPRVTDPDVWNLRESNQFSREWQWFAEQFESDGDAESSQGDSIRRHPAPTDRSTRLWNRNEIRLVVGTFLGLVVLTLAAELVLPLETFDSTTERLLRTLNQEFLVISIPLAILVEALLLYTAWRFRGSETVVETPENKPLEIAWTLATALVLVFVGLASYTVLANPNVSESPAQIAERPPNATTIEIVTEQWQYNVRYPAANVSVTDAEVVYLPRGRPVVLETTSTDVIHSIWIPDLALKQDSVPGQWTALRTRATETGTYTLYCGEFCGEGHPHMRTKVRVVPNATYQNRLTRLDNSTEK
jgi:cytochrome c oxidase subunit II